MRCKWEGQQTVQAARKPDTRCPRPGTPYLTADVSILLEPVNRRRLCISLFSGDLFTHIFNLSFGWDGLQLPCPSRTQDSYTATGPVPEPDRC